jgi:hypothetical protein
MLAPVRKIMSEKTVRSPHLIVLANEPRMMREMLQRALDSAPGCIVVDQCADLVHLNDLIQQVQLDWLVVSLGSDGEIAREALSCMKRTPTLSLMALSPDGARVEVLIRTGGQEITCFSLIEITLTALVSILRYKRDDQHLPPVLSALRAFQTGGHRHQIQRPRCGAAKGQAD